MGVIQLIIKDSPLCHTPSVHMSYEVVVQHTIVGIRHHHLGVAYVGWT